MSDRGSDDSAEEVGSGASLREARRIAWLMDESVRLPGGFRFGLDGLLGLLPGIGDLLGLVASGRIVDLARREGVGGSVLLRMLGNIGADTLVGTIPLVGDLFDFGWKANARNVALLEQELQRRTPPGGTDIGPPTAPARDDRAPPDGHA